MSMYLLAIESARGVAQRVSCRFLLIAGKEHACAPLPDQEPVGLMFRVTPPYRGYWQLGTHFNISSTKRPRWLTRKLMSWLLEINWKDSQ